MATRADKAIAALLDAALGALTLGTSLFYGPRRPGIAGPCVFVILDGGPTPEHLHTSEIRRPQVRLVTRSAKDAYDSGLDLARSVRETCHRVTSMTGYIDTLVLEPDPLYNGLTDNGEHEWSNTVELMTVET